MWRRSSSIRNVGDKSCWCRARYSSISSAAVRGGPSIIVSMIWRQTDRLHPTTAGGATNCVTDMFIGTSPYCPIKLRLPATRSLFPSSRKRHRCLRPLRSTVPPIAGLSPWDRSELFWIAGMPLPMSSIHPFEITKVLSGDWRPRLVVFDIVLFVGKRETTDADARRPPEVLLALCLRDGFANVGLQVSARCLV